VARLRHTLRPSTVVFHMAGLAQFEAREVHMVWLPRTGEIFEGSTEGMSRPAALATIAALVLAEFAIIARLIAVLMGSDMALSVG
jgi:hypothetical protein